MNSLLFVYGTLRKHEKNHHLLSQSACISEQARTKGSLFNTAAEEPAAVFGADGYICGEIYEADESFIHKLDLFYQGYHKTSVHVETDAGIKEAVVYYMKKYDCADFVNIGSGDWKEHQMISKSKDPVYYFAYGSCMDNARFQKAGVDHYFQDPVGGAVLKGYTTRFTLKRPDGSRADITEDGGTTEGVLYRLPFSAVAYLYKREGVESHTYRPAFVDVEAGGKLYTDCLTFLVLRKEAETAPPQHYQIEIERGAELYLTKGFTERLKQHMNSLPKG
ncbi:gamma-glutamylcyclotransferase [Bacillus halotolerans]|uniref:gamma-glutamylcyclotransferase n=1 Tax=Bacillus TaxID=1386 RepID=UPI000BFEF0F2|nr:MULTISPECIES: gamma-glutamylcyclotransferase [Bacillus]MCC8352199.1 gamma-glutamylcyclotransferase [Bacillus sp. AF23]PHI49076.1 gamma-glutamylcyclotransferase [Bacillus halotolerans]